MVISVLPSFGEVAGGIFEPSPHVKPHACTPISSWFRLIRRKEEVLQCSALLVCCCRGRLLSFCTFETLKPFILFNDAVSRQQGRLDSLHRWFDRANGECHCRACGTILVWQVMARWRLFASHTQLNSLQERRFALMRTSIMSKLDEMGRRVDDLERDLNSLAAQAGIGASATSSSSSPSSQRKASSSPASSRAASLALSPPSSQAVEI